MRSTLPILVIVFLLVAALSAQSDLRVGTYARLTTLTQGDFRTLLSQAESGDREAQYWVGQVYAEGRLVPKNSTASTEWMLKSAEQGYAPAQEIVGMTYMGPKGDYGEADMWLRRAAEQGNVEAQFWLGIAYEQGRIGTTDYREAFKWLRKAAEQGHPDAQVCLGQMYEDGEFVVQNYALSAKWYRKAAEHVLNRGGAFVARNNLGLLYESGLGVPKNYVLAYMWFALAYTDTILKEAAAHMPDAPEEVISHMSRAQVAQAEQMAQDWRRQHATKQEEIAGVPETKH